MNGASTFTYDNEGQLNSGYANQYGFDYEHRLVGTNTDRYYYHGNGNRLLAERSTVATRYIYDAAGNLLAEADGNNNITKYYVYGLGLIAMVDSSNAVYSYHFNATGSTIAITNSSKNIVNKYAYDPFGNIANQSETITQPFKFVGQFGVMTEPNGFYYMRARYYDPNTGRFISEDPIGFGGGDVNLMAYVFNNPVNLVDPNGQLAFFWHFGITLVSAISNGMGLESFAIAGQDVWADLKPGTQAQTAAAVPQHAMRVAGQTPEQAIANTISLMQQSISKGNLGYATHAGVDLATPSHAGNVWEGFTVSHILGDLFPSWTTIKNAYNNVSNIISGNTNNLVVGGKP